MGKTSATKSGIFSLAVFVSALGYFVDVYDLLLFNIVRLPSLRDLGVAETDLFHTGIWIINLQLIGLLVGGVLFGILGDKIGRTKLLFLSIFTYSLATLGCAFVQQVSTYALLRFIAGIGLSGELGLAITLVTEILPLKKRGYGTTLIAGFAPAGAVMAAMLAQILDWRTCYLIGSIMGFALLFLRMQVKDSMIFLQQPKDKSRGNLRIFFGNWRRTARFVGCILIGMPVPYVMYMLAGFAPELTKSFGLLPVMTAAEAILWGYIGFTLGDFAGGLLSQWLQSRRTALLSFMVFGFAASSYFLMTGYDHDKIWFQMFYCLLGLSVGCWTIVVTISAESFGTNLRATAATNAPNIARATFVPMSLIVAYLQPSIGILDSMLVLGIIVFTLTFISAYLLSDTFHKDLDYAER
ncbi:MAG: MFS transporter [Alphaproteobacteria bacterium]|nr:MAG: MFS transporter [Alphaproteobacteria bacterium]